MTTLSDVPPEAWEYQLGNRSALEWVLDQHKERKPRHPTIAERFNTYQSADHKERVIDLLRRVCAVSVRTGWRLWGAWSIRPWCLWWWPGTGASGPRTG